MPSSSEPKLEPVIIKKYANRRLYNTDTSSYITLEHLATMVREGREFKVLDAKSGEDITRSVLTQIIMEEENRGQTMLPISFLRQLIALYGDSMQALVPHYLEASMEALRRNQEQFRDALSGAFSSPALKPFETLARQNLAMFQAAAEMLSGAADPKAEQASEGEGSGSRVTSKEDELKAIREQMAALQSRLDKLASH